MERGPGLTIPDAAPVINLAGVSKCFVKGEEAIDTLTNVNLRILPGEFVSIVGPSGCGKSTLLNLISGLTQPTGGSVSYFGAPVSGVNTRVGYMTQDDNLLPWRTVLENIALPRLLKRNHLAKNDRTELAQRYIDDFGLKGFEHHFPSEISGGMRKRVALARTLIYEPDTLLMDEPFAALDAQLRLEMQNELLRLWESRKMTILFITHDIAEAILLSTRIDVMTARPGTLTHSIPVELNRPRNLKKLQFSRQFADLYTQVSDILATAG